jgi:hypothetical protein
LPSLFTRRCFNFIGVVNVPDALDKKYTTIGNGYASFEAVDFEWLRGSGVGERFLPEDGAEEEVEFVDLRWS